MMSLFPAYGQDAAGLTQDAGELERINSMASLDMEVQLLASDSETESESKAPQKSAPSAAHAVCGQDYYVDNKLDCGNLRVSTLYFPGRPQYEYRKRRALGLRGCWGGSAKVRGRGRRERYYREPAAAAAAPDEAAERAECAERDRALRRLLDDNPRDVALWLTLIDFHEGCGPGGAETALAAAEQGAARVPTSRRLRLARHRLRRAHLSLDDTLERLRADLDKVAESSEAPRARRETWTWIVECAGARGGVEASLAAAAAALRGARGAGGALYPALVRAHGEVARAAGLHEHLVLLVELLAAMCFPRTPAAAAFPPRTDAHALRHRDELLHRKEDELIASGLPLGVVWARVERARAAAHWRPVADVEAEAGADPQRAPAPADVADLLVPVRDARAAFLLAVNMLTLAKVPLMGGAASALGEVGAVGSVGGGDGNGGGACGERVLALVRAARHLPPRHPARPAPQLARQALALLVDPPHYFTDDAGYLSWVNGLWEACCSWFEGSQRSALVCWWLRWLHAQALALAAGDGGAGEAEAEGARLRREARGALRRHGGADPLPYAQLARLQAALGEPAAARTALHALAAATRDHTLPDHYPLYIARVVREVCGARSTEGAWALCCGALRTDLPHADRVRAAPPPPDLVRRALDKCVERCDALERRWEEEEEAEAEGCEWDGMLPSEGEWGAARALLAPADRLPALEDRLHHAHTQPEWCVSAAAARYWAGSAAVLATRLHARAYRRLAALQPGNTLLALGSSGAPLWAWRRRRGGEGRARGPDAALALVLPPLYAALDAGWTPREASRVVSACTRAGGGGAGAGAVVWAARLEAEARAERPRCARALVAALDALPHCKWLYVRAARWAPDAAALPDMLLHRHMRLHALLDELHPHPHPLNLNLNLQQPSDTDKNLLDLEQ